MKFQNYPAEAYRDLKQMLHQVAQKHPTKAAFLQKAEETYRACRYEKYEADVNGLGEALLQMGLGGGRILLVGQNCYRWAVAFMAIACGVGTVVPVDHELTHGELRGVARYAEADAVICEDRLARVFATKEKRMRVIPLSQLNLLVKQGRERIRAGARSYLDCAIDPDAMCAMVFSSGTWGEMRGVMLSHRNLCFAVAEMRCMVAIEARDVFLSVLPLHHIYECVCGFLCPLSCGCTVAFAESVEQMGKNMREVSPTVMLCVPAVLEGMYRRVWEQITAHGAEARVKRLIEVTNALPNPKLSLAAKQKSFAPLHRVFGGKLRLLISGGAAASVEALNGLRDLGIPALQGYGMTECASVIALNRDTHYRNDSAGLPTPNALLDIADMQEDGLGEIRYRGDSVMLGYYRMPRRTAEVLRDGWFYTGDLGYFDEDGFLHVMGRAQNVIALSDGRKILPEVLERLLCRSPYIKEAVVLSHRREGAEGPEPMAILCPNPERIAEDHGGETSDELVELLIRRALAETNSELSVYQRINDFQIRHDPLPKNATGKIKRHELVEQV